MIKQLFASSFALCGCLHLFLTQESPASCPLQAEIGCASELFSAWSRTPSATCCKPQFRGQTQPAANDSSISPNNLKLQRGETRISWDHLFNAYQVYHFSYLQYILLSTLSPSWTKALKHVIAKPKTVDSPVDFTLRARVFVGNLIDLNLIHQDLLASVMAASPSLAYLGDMLGGLIPCACFGLFQNKNCGRDNSDKWW